MSVDLLLSAGGVTLYRFIGSNNLSQRRRRRRIRQCNGLVIDRGTVICHGEISWHVKMDLRLSPQPKQWNCTMSISSKHRLSVMNAFLVILSEKLWVNIRREKWCITIKFYEALKKLSTCNNRHWISFKNAHYSNLWRLCFFSWYFIKRFFRILWTIFFTKNSLLFNMVNSYKRNIIFTTKSFWLKI